MRRAFDPIYPDVSEERGALLYPFFLDGVALNPDLNLADGMHPNAKGVAVIVENILPMVEELLLPGRKVLKRLPLFAGNRR